MANPSWHTMTEDEVLAKLGASAEGLSGAEAQTRRQESGPNQLEAEEGVGVLKRVIDQVKSPLIYLLVLAAIVSVLAEHYIDSVFIFGVVILNTLIGVVQEWRAENAMEKLHQMASPKATVLREGRPDTIPAAEVTVGDILVLETGQRVAADGRVLFTEELQVNESALTGESQPVYKSPEPLDRPDLPVGDRRNMVYMSTSVTAGRGRAVVTATGMNTELGRIAGQVRGTKREKTPLQKKIGRLGLYLGLVGIALAVMLFVIGMIQGYDTVEILLFAVAAAVSAIPEGLPAVISVTLALGVQRMAKHNAIIRRLPAVETLGSTTVVCSDKTGTITKNEMTVTRIWAGGQTWEVTGQGYRPEGEFKRDGMPILPEDFGPALRRLMEIGYYANNARLKERDGDWEIEGTPTEGALVAVSRKAGLDCGQMAKQKERLDEIPFSSDKKFMAALYPEEDRSILYVKGAPDRIITFCSGIFWGREEKELNRDHRDQIARISDEFAARALRIIAGAYRIFPAGKTAIGEEDATEGLIFTGLWGIVDPPRPEAIRAIEDARRAGIHVVMLTGDHAATASAIAREVGIAPGSQKAVTGPEIERMSDEEIAEHAMKAGVFARVSPEHKLTILRALKQRKQIVAMTGDGVNDAPALKGADIGVAMGQACTEVAREAADMLLSVYNFATIIRAVEEGRVIFRNLVSVTFFLVSTSANEMLPLTAALLMRLPLPLTAIMILWINLITDGVSNIPLGVEPMHEDVLNLPPREPGAGIFDWKLLRRVVILSIVVAAGVLGLYYYRLQNAETARARTLAFTTLAAFQWCQAFNARSRHLSVFRIGVFSNRWLVLGVSVAILLQLGVIYAPVGQAVFGTTALTFWDWLLLAPTAATVLVADELLKFFGLNGGRMKHGKR